MLVLKLQGNKSPYPTILILENWGNVLLLQTRGLVCERHPKIKTNPGRSKEAESLFTGSPISSSKSVSLRPISISKHLDPALEAVVPRFL
jgi:hypothetical protein